MKEKAIVIKQNRTQPFNFSGALAFDYDVIWYRI